jgi:hypothetical protein
MPITITTSQVRTQHTQVGSYQTTQNASFTLRWPYTIQDPILLSSFDLLKQGFYHPKR